MGNTIHPLKYDGTARVWDFSVVTLER